MTLGMLKSVREEDRLERMFGLIGAALGGWLGWAVGSPFSIYAGLFASLLGTAAGIWFARRIIADYF